ncbi:hypothetical protein L1049_005346 [Liquidambar formosana]|uniref:Uncharacterized protein n=1 Tax=Liquidambar formosana TaxID=63359 RepID=A0AAP0WWJ0_LIQFO
MIGCLVDFFREERTIRLPLTEEDDEDGEGEMEVDAAVAMVEKERRVKGMFRWHLAIGSRPRLHSLPTG